MPPIVQWVLAGVTLVTFLAAAAVFLRGSADKGTITSLQNSVNALKTESELKDKKIIQLEAKAAECAARIQALEKVVTSADLIIHLQAEVEAQSTLLLKIAQKVGATHA